ncbi:MAG TPA: hypothetical protein ENH04_02380 [Nitrospirae bacterium]|nr:hypothetical protein [Nitrospirota bacterium]
MIGVIGNNLTIGFNGGMSVLSDSVKKNAPLIETALHDVTGRKLRLKIVSLPEEEKKSLDEIKKEVSSDPIIKDAIKLFDGKIVQVRPLKG